MPFVADRIDFATRYITNKEGRKWSLKGRDWVKDQLAIAADGWKLWRYEGKDCCSSCAEQIGNVIESPVFNPTEKCECGGLEPNPIIVSIFNLERQDGKTFNSMALLALPDLFRARNKSIAALWASEDQGTQIFDEVYRAAIERSEKLSGGCRIYGQPPQIFVPTTGSRFEVLAASDRSATGRSRTRILIDEARDIPAKLAMKLIPAVFAMAGIECPSGHVQLSLDEATNAPKKCTACGLDLVKWFGRITITTSSGVLEGGEHDWSNDLIEELRQRPHPNYHLFASEQTLNPSKSTVIMNAISDVFGRLESTRHYSESEIGNRWTRKGSDFATKAELKRITDETLINTTSATDVPCVAYLDTSRVGEKTSLVIVADDKEKSESPWQYVYQIHLDYWIPANQPNRVIDDQVIYERLCLIMPLYTGLRSFRVDTRGSQWSVQLLEQIKKERTPWSKRTAAWQDIRYANRDSGWGFLQERILKGTIRIQNDKAQMKEFAGIMVKAPPSGGPPRVTDRNRATSHVDITESLACCCYLVQQEQTKRNVGLSVLTKRRTARDLLQTTRHGKRFVDDGAQSAGGQAFGPNGF